ncbi:hypothetical protein HYALB_00013994 [Hymenoscyphus albidus]|uniref:Uncharacterized protein n=1 Tax=Hymenoscyphus albidus TaxID=595503 RepID=A0A9N9M2F0_9HELO|nr:hypothetical protein HYALB_00013994 [Hymenoscyphus albidus]
MLARIFFVGLWAIVTVAIPVAKPANFETDPMLQVGEVESSSYAEKRANFETDPMLQVGEVENRSYAQRL